MSYFYSLSLLGLSEDDIPAKIVIPCRQNQKVFKGVILSQLYWMPFIIDDCNSRGLRENESITHTDVQPQETNAKLYISFAT